MTKEHERGTTYPVFALDHVEPLRPVVDRAILDLVSTETFTGSDFSIQHDDVCRLNPELARRVAQCPTTRKPAKETVKRNIYSLNCRSNR